MQTQIFFLSRTSKWTSVSDREINLCIIQYCKIISEVISFLIQPISLGIRKVFDFFSLITYFVKICSGQYNFLCSFGDVHFLPHSFCLQWMYCLCNNERPSNCLCLMEFSLELLVVNKDEKRTLALPRNVV